MTKKQIIFDTNIVSRLMSQSGRDAYVKELDKLAPQYSFLVTLYTQYELLKSSDQANQKIITEFLSRNYPRVMLNEKAMNFSARIHNLYKQEPTTKGRSITDGDIINAALTIALNCEILTIDNTDYPRPFFMEKQRYHISYTSTKDRPVMDVAYLLEPDMDYLKHCADLYKI